MDPDKTITNENCRDYLLPVLSTVWPELLIIRRPAGYCFACQVDKGCILETAEDVDADVSQWYQHFYEKYPELSQWPRWDLR